MKISLHNYITQLETLENTCVSTKYTKFHNSMCQAIKSYKLHSDVDQFNHR